MALLIEAMVVWGKTLRGEEKRIEGKRRELEQRREGGGQPQRHMAASTGGYRGPRSLNAGPPVAKAAG